MRIAIYTIPVLKSYCVDEEMDHLHSTHSAHSAQLHVTRHISGWLLKRPLQFCGEGRQTMWSLN